jgi:hypothetical protein
MMTRDELFKLAETRKGEVNYEKIVKVVAREVAMRGNLYPKKMLEGRMTEDEAVAEVAAMMVVLDLVIVIRDAPGLAARQIVERRR